MNDIEKLAKLYHHYANAVEELEQQLGADQEKINEASRLLSRHTKWLEGVRSELLRAVKTGRYEQYDSKAGRWVEGNRVSLDHDYKITFRSDE